MTEIQRGIVMPNPGGNRKYPWKTMQVGDSFVHPGSRNTARTHAYISGRTFGMKFTCREVVEDGRTVSRVWRTA